jgi:hypothetical protein
MKSILFGNGLNYLSKNFISWKQLLDKIKGDNLFENGKLPNTMIYERSIIGNPISFDTLTQKEEAIKQDIAKMLENFPSNPFYDKLAELNAENYLTTNYDYAMLETYKSNSSFKIVNKSTEGIYSIRRHKDILQNGRLKTKLWHLHGEIDIPPSIMLGLDHYCGSVAKIDSYVKGRYEYQEDKKTVKTPSIIDKLNSKPRFDQSSWVELFFNSNIYIIGLGLDFSEIDLWWVLNKRARFKLDNQTKNLVNNKVTFFSTSDDKDHMETLKSLHIDIIEVKLNASTRNYGDAYDKILDLIQQD